nr:alpha/beta hydrolase [arsenite-oxidising bacterium NT-25]
MSIIARNNVTVRGVGERARVFAHGFGCDQNMWRHVTPAFEQEYKVVLFDHVGVRQVGSSRL